MQKKIIPTYRIDKSYEENYNLGPLFDGDVPKKIPKKEIDFLGFKLRSPVGIFAGPLLNSKWIKLYAKLGYGILTYKTVRTHAVKCHPFPNSVCIDIKDKDQLSIQSKNRPAFLSPQTNPGEKISITASFGMPSQNPDVWENDIKKAKSCLMDGQILVVSVVGDDANDFAKCAQLADESGADVIEANFSCPNVKTKEGSIFLDPKLSGIIVKQIKEKIGETPLIVKIGHIEDKNFLRSFIKETMGFINGVVCVNGISMKILEKGGSPFLGEERISAGISGHSIRDCGEDMVKKVREIKKELDADFVILGGGGIFSPEHIEKYLNLGADIAMSATGIMWNPLLAYQYSLKK